MYILKRNITVNGNPINEQKEKKLTMKNKIYEIERRTSYGF